VSLQTETVDFSLFDNVKAASKRDVSGLAAMLRNAIARGGDGEEPVDPLHRVTLVLYTSDSLYSARARAMLERIVADYDPEQIDLSFVDVTDPMAGARADEDGIIATPTLVKAFPGPKMWIAGTLDDGEVVRRLLDNAGVDKKQ
jgi:hypothetical protein